MVFKRASVLAVGAVAALALVSAIPALASVGGDPQTTPPSYTPFLLKTTPNQNVQELVPCGGNMYAVGTISAVGQGSKNTYTRGNAFSFSATTGKMTAWDPQVNGAVDSIAFSPDCSVAYIGGKFNQVGATKAFHIAEVDTVTGAIIPKFAHNTDNEVNTVQYTHGQIVIGGSFQKVNGISRTLIASLDPTTGAVTPWVNLAISGTYPNSNSKVYNSQLSHAGDRMLIEGVFTSIAGQGRQQMAVLDLGDPSVTLDNWFSLEFNGACSGSERFYVRSGAWSPDDATIYAASTGYKPLTGPGSSTRDPRAGLCDSAAAFPSTPALVNHKWINYTGCDSYYSVAADANRVYVAGHERWASNPNGCDAAGLGAVSRPGLASLNAADGTVSAWNPTRSLGFGADDITVTSAGVWIGSDTFSNGASQMCGGKFSHGGICFLPY